MKALSFLISRKGFGIAALLLLLAVNSQAQRVVPYFGKINWVSGYAREISGENISYFSAFPDYATVALLTRTTDGNKAIEWETSLVPKNSKGPYVYFSWVAGHSSGSSSGNRHFDLYVDGEKLLTFTTYPGNVHPDWSFTGPDSSRLVFQQTKRDGPGDAHGLAFLRLPISKVKPGQPVRLKVVGQAQSSNDWYMTFKFSFEEKVEVNPTPFLLKNGKQLIVLTSLHFGKDEPLTVRVNKKETHVFTVKEGITLFDIPVPAIQHPDSVFIQVTAGNKTLVNRYVALKPVVYRELDFIHHSHTDIGYSHLQTDVMKIHLRNIDDALVMIEKTKDFPADARFKWNIESLWAVENYLKQATPAQQEKFIGAVRAGSICLSGLYANILTGMSEPEEVFHYTEYAEKLRKDFGVTINMAMISDIPGYAWTTVTGLSRGGIRYFSSGPNYLGESHPYWGDRVGFFVRNWGDRPVWWASPSGEEKILFWTGGKGYSSWHGTAVGGVFDRGPKIIASYLNELIEKKYPYDMVQWRYNVVADNGPIDTSVSQFVKEWNEKYASPRIVLNTTSKLFETFEQKYGDKLPVVRGDITPYWEDGAISTASEEGINRINSLRLQQLTNLYAILHPAGFSPEEFRKAWTNIIMFHEHTWGAYNSTSNPDVPFVKEQWRVKRMFMSDGDEQVNRLGQNLWQAVSEPQSGTVAVINTLSWIHSGPVVLEGATSAKSVKDSQGKFSPLQKTSDGHSLFIAENVPALGTSTYELSDTEAGGTANTALTDSTLSNGLVTMAWDKSLGSIITLKKTNGPNLAGQYRGQGLNSYWYVGFDPALATTNGKVQVTVLDNGPVVTTVSVVSDAPGAVRLERRYSLYAGSETVAIENLLDKKAIREKEGVHFGFPFEASLSKATLDAGYGTMNYLADQLPGSDFDYLYGRRWLDVAGQDNGLQWLLLETPLVEPNDMIDERHIIDQSHKVWKKEGKPATTWFSYAMNNYWHTNYKADQEGVARFRYALRPHAMVNATEMEQSAEAFTQPLTAIHVKKGSVPPGSLFELTNSRVMVTSITPEGEGTFRIRLFNPEPVVQQTGFIWRALKPGMLTESSSDQKIGPNHRITLAASGITEIVITK